MDRKSALIITDMQNDFCEGGSLAIQGADSLIPLINSFSASFHKVIASQDWHPRNHISFASTHMKPRYTRLIIDGLEQELWPDHCLEGTLGSDFRKGLNLEPVDLILRKGTEPRMDSYSVFRDNNRINLTGLSFYLKGLNITNLYFCGLATDYCIFYSSTDAVIFGFKAFVITDAIRGVNFPEGSIETAFREMRKSGVNLIASAELMTLAAQK